MGDKRGGWSGKTLVWLPNSKLNSECTEEGALCGSNGRRDLSPIQVRFVGVQQYSHAKCFHASIRASLFSPSVTHRNSFVHPPHNDSLIRQKYIRGTLSLLFRISLDFDNYDRRDENAWRIQGIEGDRHVRVHPWEICTYGVCIPWNSSAQVSANI